MCNPVDANAFYENYIVRLRAIVGLRKGVEFIHARCIALDVAEMDAPGARHISQTLAYLSQEERKLERRLDTHPGMHERFDTLKARFLRP